MVTARSISPGESGVIVVSFDARKRTGTQKNTVRLTTNDPRNEVVELTIHAFVRTDLAVEPKNARLGSVDCHEEKVIRLKLLIENPQKVAVTRIGSSSPLVSGQVVEDPDRPGGQLLEIRVAGGRSIGKFQEKVLVETSSPTQPKIVIPVSGLVLGDIRLEPPAIGFEASGRPDPGASPLEVVVRTVGAEPFQITGLEDTTGYLRTELEELEAGRTFRILIWLSTEGLTPVPESFNGVLRVATTHPEQPFLDLAVYRAGRVATH